MEFRPFRAGHLTYFVPQAAQRKDYTAMKRSGEAHQLEGPLALSAWRGSECVGAAGLIPIRAHRALAWAIFGANLGGAGLVSVVRKVRRVIDVCPYQRIELTVAAEFDAGLRFAEMIGAVRETPEPMRKFGANMEDEYMYAIVKGV